MAKRIYDTTLAMLGLILLSPLLLGIALGVKLADGGPVFYRQWRVGERGRLFRIVKFRSMVVDADATGIQITKGGDPRITRIGQFLRSSKLDELPQLWNVLTGEMSFVGPRPEVPKYVARYSPDQRQVLNLKPGITDPATLAFRDEEEQLRGVQDVESHYLNYCVPRKIELNLAYAREANLWRDTKLILQTVFTR